MIMLRLTVVCRVRGDNIEGMMFLLIMVMIFKDRLFD